MHFYEGAPGILETRIAEDRSAPGMHIVENELKHL